MVANFFLLLISINTITSLPRTSNAGFSSAKLKQSPTISRTFVRTFVERLCTTSKCPPSTSTILAYTSGE